MSAKIIRPGEVQWIDNYLNSGDRETRPKFNLKVADLVSEIIARFNVDPASLCDFYLGWAEDCYRRQVVIVEVPGCTDTNEKFKHRGEHTGVCADFFHCYKWSGEMAYRHFKVMAWHGDYNEVCARLKKWFEPANGARPRRIKKSDVSPVEAPPERIVLPDIGSLEERVGLSDFMRG